jgi:membrane-associated protease RseP (regulator of RpoE activity)
MKRTFLLVLLALALTCLMTTTAFADTSNGQGTRSNTGRFFLPSPLLIYFLRYLFSRKEASQWGASDQQWGASKRAPKQRSNVLRNYFIIAVVVVIIGVVAGILSGMFGGGKRDNHADLAPIPTSTPTPSTAPNPTPASTPTRAPTSVPIAPERDVAAKRGYLGVKVQAIEAELAPKVVVKGVQITQLYDQSPAAKCGLKLNDIILTIADKAVSGGNELRKVVEGLPLGQAVDVVVSRGGKSLKLSLTIEAEPDKFGSN